MIGCAGAKPANRIHRLPQEAIDKDQRLRDIQQSTSRLIGGEVPIVVQKIEMNVYEAIRNAEEGHTAFRIEAMMDCPLFVGDWVLWVGEYHEDCPDEPVSYVVGCSHIALVEVRGVA